MKLNLGCSSDYRQGWVNHDITNKDIYHQTVNPDIEWDLNEYPWPWEDNTFDEICASAILEHLDSKTKPWKELYRIAKSKCKLFVNVPHYSGTSAYDDITPLHQYSTFALNRAGQMFGWKVISGKIIFSRNKYLCWVTPIIKIWPRFYERFLCGIFPSQELDWWFEKV